MKIPEFVPKSVVFVGAPALKACKKQDYLSGTGFFVGRVSARVDAAHVYIVTARHVIDGTASVTGGLVYFCVNHRDWGRQWIETQSTDWIRGDSDIDVAVLPFTPAVNNIDHTVIPGYAIVSQGNLRSGGYSLELGDEVGISGLFVHHAGENRNTPIVRIGNLATGLEKNVSAKLGDNWYGKINAYLIEARSIGGLSGSPVFVHRVDDGMPKYALLGLMQGHYGLKLVDSPADMPNDTSINSGIGIVVPVDDIERVFNLPEILEMEKLHEDGMLSRNGAEADIR